MFDCLLECRDLTRDKVAESWKSSKLDRHYIAFGVTKSQICKFAPSELSPLIIYLYMSLRSYPLEPAMLSA